MADDCHPDCLPDVFIRILHVLQQDTNQPVAWKLSKSVDGKFSLFVTHFPAGLRTR